MRIVKYIPHLNYTKIYFVLVFYRVVREYFFEKYSLLPSDINIVFASPFSP